MTPTLHIHLLGDFLLTAGETPVTTITIPRLQSLLAYLLLHRDAPQDRSHLAFLLWPDSTEAQAHANLRQLVYRLRQSLPYADQLLHADKQSLQWLPTHVDWTLDVLEFEQACILEQVQKKVVTRQTLEQVIRLYRGDLLPDCDEEWIVPERERLCHLFLQVAERLIALLEQERDYTTAIEIAHKLLRHDPLHEETYCQLMRLLAVHGDREEALRVYNTCVTSLERRLGVKPSEATQETYNLLLRATPRIPALMNRGVPLLGRNAEWQHLQEMWRKAGRGRSHMVMLTGEAGIGKTRLAEEMQIWVSRQGMTAVSAHCYPTLGHLPYTPVTAWLRTAPFQAHLLTLDPALRKEIARLVPEILRAQPLLPQPTISEMEWHHQRLLEALTHAVLSMCQPLLLVLDDLHWCDQQTLEWLHYLLRFAPEACLLLVATLRPEEILPGHSLLTFLNMVQRDGLITEISPGPLTITETNSLAEHIMGHSLDPALSVILYHETEGNPLFVVEMVHAGTLEQAEREPSTAKSPQPLLTYSGSTLPPMVQNVLSTRLAQLSPLAREIANVAAVIGHEFTFSLLVLACEGREDAVAQGLDELWQRGIGREQCVGTIENYNFTHVGLREQIYTSLSPATRRLLQRRFAEACKVMEEGEGRKNNSA
ncbi:MAG: AAA family ATPase [Ktedonobacteraceae bacterium]|nr:AAA family ATPase [Ktedonobacteraceae bacterium]